MDTVQSSVNEIKDAVFKRMEEIEAQLKSPSSTPASVSSLAADFSAYRTFVIQAFKMLQQQVDALAHTVDGIEMQRRRKILLLHGVEEKMDEDTSQTVVNVVKQHFSDTDFSVGHIKRCQRLGRAASPKKPRPILVKVHDLGVRNVLWYNKTKLKGSGVTISEFLTKYRHDIFMSAREALGVKKSWTKDGCVYVLGPDDARHRVSSLAELKKIAAIPPKSSDAPKTATTKPRRAAAVKK